MRTQQLAAQLYTVRDLLKTPEKTIETLSRIRDAGYGAVQVSGFSYAVMPEADLLAQCRRIGLRICATHEGGQMILEQPEAVVARLNALDCRYTAYPYPGGIDVGDGDAVNAFLKGLDAAVTALAAAGKVLCYHNHHIEFRKVNGRILLDRIYDETAVQGELDTYWVQFGGGDPAAWVRRLNGRCPLIHLKDYMITDENTVTMTEIGNGVLDMPGIVRAADEAGCEWFIVEQDTCPGDPVDSLAASFRYLKALADD